MQQDLILVCMPMVDWLKVSPVQDSTAYVQGVNPDRASCPYWQLGTLLLDLILALLRIKWNISPRIWFTAIHKREYGKIPNDWNPQKILKVTKIMKQISMTFPGKLSQILCLWLPFRFYLSIPRMSFPTTSIPSICTYPIQFYFLCTSWGLGSLLQTWIGLLKTKMPSHK